MKTNHATMPEIERLFQEYEKEVMATEKAGHYSRRQLVHIYYMLEIS